MTNWKDRAFYVILAITLVALVILVVLVLVASDDGGRL